MVFSHELGCDEGMERPRTELGWLLSRLISELRDVGARAVPRSRAAPVVRIRSHAAIKENRADILRVIEVAGAGFRQLVGAGGPLSAHLSPH